MQALFLVADKLKVASSEQVSKEFNHLKASQTFQIDACLADVLQLCMDTDEELADDDVSSLVEVFQS